MSLTERIERGPGRREPDNNIIPLRERRGPPRQPAWLRRAQEGNGLAKDLSQFVPSGSDGAA